MEDGKSSFECCSLPGPKSTSEPLTNTGSTISLDNLNVYLTGPDISPATTKALICIYDIFGSHPSTHHGADILSSLTGLPVLVPDFFLERGWSPSNMPPKEGREAMQAHIRSIGAWGIVKPLLRRVVEYLRKHGVESVGIYGFCFGGKKVVECFKDEEMKGIFKAAALVHPTNLEGRDGEVFDVPVALVPSAGEDEEIMDSIWKTLKGKNVGERCVRRDFLDDKHGFASARAEWDDPVKAARVKEVYDVLGKFFNKNL